jgi:hypothetical protein
VRKTGEEIAGVGGVLVGSAESRKTTRGEREDG